MVCNNQRCSFVTVCVTMMKEMFLTFVLLTVADAKHMSDVTHTVKSRYTELGYFDASFISKRCQSSVSNLRIDF